MKGGGARLSQQAEANEEDEESKLNFGNSQIQQNVMNNSGNMQRVEHVEEEDVEEDDDESIDNVSDNQHQS